MQPALEGTGTRSRTKIRPNKSGLVYLAKGRSLRMLDVFSSSNSDTVSEDVIRLNVASASFHVNFLSIN